MQLFLNGVEWKINEHFNPRQGYIIPNESLREHLVANKMLLRCQYEEEKVEFLVNILQQLPRSRELMPLLRKELENGTSSYSNGTTDYIHVRLDSHGKAVPQV
ncbi:unnamed protein product, partial [Mesorhabditis belari]|uniref:Uncharacterized protein n=1 Tax=Mesorhabditis belari TaxID=2138241 RepID=A0AAF3J9D7_9BILA